MLNLNGDHRCTHCMSLNFKPHFLSQYYESQSGLTRCWPIRCKYFDDFIKCLVYSVYIAVVLFVTDYEALETLLRYQWWLPRVCWQQKRCLEFNRSC